MGRSENFPTNAATLSRPTSFLGGGSVSTVRSGLLAGPGGAEEVALKLFKPVSSLVNAASHVEVFTLYPEVP